ncbi:enoyl-CoA hydratase-related protein [Lewinella sp. JB7]|uniref:enoyl-CoA hydratase-related protein n=1 Tax=Lewinella sp. JB7 TaxID=2962887 RepID=UPI0020C99BB3|nr:enoyl-CoA hydratase-related protein [Lewinella sp. JB7]MCP9237233.1 enoyl-CoA hydratase-related protein [Lewinella sp. JB7]
MEYAVNEHIATLTFDRPEKANALDLAGWEAMRTAFARADADESVHVVILRGRGKHFCAGIDLSVLGEMQRSLTGTPEEIEQLLLDFIANLQDCITAIERCRKPVIAAIHGGCIGGGVDIMTACDIRYATKDAYFSVKEVDLGIVADLGTLQRLPRIVSPGIAAELAFTARRVDGKEAHRIGLVNEVLASEKQLNYHVGQIADAIAAKPPRIITGIKRNLLHQRDHSLAEGLEYVAGYSAGVMMPRDRK